MKNIGPKSRQWLAEVGILTDSDLERVGSIAAYRAVKRLYPKKASLNLLWALEAAIQNCHWQEISAEEKAALRIELEDHPLRQ